MRLVGADDHIYAFHVESLQWLADTDLLEMLVDKLSPPVILLFLHLETTYEEFDKIFCFIVHGYCLSNLHICQNLGFALFA